MCFFIKNLLKVELDLKVAIDEVLVGVVDLVFF